MGGGGVLLSVPHYMPWLFQISHICVTECTLQAKFLLKIIWKLLEIPFFPICGISQYVIFLSNRRGKFKLLDLQGDPLPPQFPCLVGHPNLPMRKTLRVVGLLAAMVFFQSKKFTACKMKDEKRRHFFIFWWCSIYWKLSIHLKVKNI